MAKIVLNESIHQLRGKVGQWVYRQHGRETVVSPLVSRKDRPSAKQTKRRARFAEAQNYARTVLSEPLKRAHYQDLGRQRNCPPNALLISNFLTPPSIDAIERDGRNIHIAASDTIEVVSVTVTLRAADGTKLESGTATKDHGVWTYKAETVATGAVEVIARNRAGAQATRSA